MESTNSRGGVMTDNDGGDRIRLRDRLVSELTGLMQTGTLAQVELKLAEIMGHGLHLGLAALDRLYVHTEANTNKDVRSTVARWIAEARGKQEDSESLGDPEYRRLLQGDGVVAAMIDDVTA